MTQPYDTRRVRGELVKFDKKQGFAHIRFGDTLYLAPVSHRGTLTADESIVHCLNGDRHDSLCTGSKIVFNLVYDSQGKNPCTGLWAPFKK